MSETQPTLDLNGPVFEAIRKRRVTREFSTDPIPEDYILTLLEAARWAPTGGGRRVIEYIILKNSDNIRKIRAVSPGILNLPQAIIMMVINHSKEAILAFDDSEQGSSYTDIGTAAENILLTAQELKVGVCPIMSFHKGAVRILLELPKNVEPVMMIILGYPKKQTNNLTKKLKRLQLSNINEITNWEKYGQRRINN